MKHIKIFLITALLAAVIVPVSGCGNSSNSEQASTNTQSGEVATQKSEDEHSENELTEREQRLLDRLIAITREDFFEPSKVRILEIPIYGGDGVFKHDPDPNRDYYASGSDEVTTTNEYAVVRLQGENKVGGTLNHYYAICISERNKKSGVSKSADDLQYDKQYNTEDYCEYDLNAGEYFDLEDDYKTTETLLGKKEINWYSTNESNYFDIGKVNKAFAAYWKDMGFE